MEGFEKEDSSILGFITICRLSACINNQDIRKFFEHLIEKNNVNELPLFIFDLVDFDAGGADFAVYFEFTPSSGLNDDEENALYGIAYKRGIEPYDCPLTREEALKKLEQYPHIEAKFRELFPFVELGK